LLLCFSSHSLGVYAEIPTVEEAQPKPIVPDTFSPVSTSTTTTTEITTSSVAILSPNGSITSATTTTTTATSTPNPLSDPAQPYVPNVPQYTPLAPDEIKVCHVRSAEFVFIYFYVYFYFYFIFYFIFFELSGEDFHFISSFLSLFTCDFSYVCSVSRVVSRREYLSDGVDRSLCAMGLLSHLFVFRHVYVLLSPLSFLFFFYSLFNFVLSDNY
jgi:hypothetical protein